MFGLTSYSNYPGQSNAYLDFRKSYCGTCKTIGKIYGNKERFFLNHDVVFLNELLSEVDGNKDSFSEITIYKCFDLPKSELKIPAFLKYSAAVNILLAYYKINDNALDSKYKLNIWNPIKSLEKKNFRKAQDVLAAYGVDLNLVESNIHEQSMRESSPLPLFQNQIECFNYYASPTKIITGEIFKNSVNTFGTNKLSDFFQKIGEKFGEIVYLLDAIEDYTNDLKSAKFNPFKIICNEAETLPNEFKNDVIDYIYNNLSLLAGCINSLPIPENKQKLFVSRLYNNVNIKLGKIYKTSKTCNCSHIIPPLKERIKDAVIITNSKVAHHGWILKTIKYPSLITLLVLYFTLFPHIAYGDWDPHKDSCGDKDFDMCHCCCNNMFRCKYDYGYVIATVCGGFVLSCGVICCLDSYMEKENSGSEVTLIKEDKHKIQKLVGEPDSVSEDSLNQNLLNGIIRSLRNATTLKQEDTSEKLRGTIIEVRGEIVDIKTSIVEFKFKDQYNEHTHYVSLYYDIYPKYKLLILRKDFYYIKFKILRVLI